MLTNAFVIERPNGEVKGYNCQVTRQGNELKVVGSENQIANLHCNLKHPFTVFFKGKSQQLKIDYQGWAFEGNDLYLQPLTTN